jgi:hypothetical protein
VTGTSERIRSLIAEPMTAAQVSESLAVRVKLVRGLIQTMLRLGIVTKVGDKRPYQYQVSRELKEQNRGFGLKSNTSQKIRDLLKKEDMTPAQICRELGLKSDRAYQHLRDMIPGGYIAKNVNGTYRWLKDPAPPMSEEEKNRKKNERRRAQRAANPPAPRPIRRASTMPIVIRKPQPQCVKPSQTVEEWLANGGVIDRSPTQSRFERLTTEDILARSGVAIGFQMPKSPRLSPEGKW